MKQLAQRIFEYRVKYNLSQSAFADLCKLSTQTINYVENELQKPSKMTVAKIEQVIGKDED